MILNNEFEGDRLIDEKEVSLFKEIGFPMAFLFKYSKRTGTDAADRGDQVPQEVKEARLKVLLDILEDQSIQYNQSLVGTTQEILVEGPARKGESKYMGRPRGHRKVVFTGSERLVGELVEVRINEASVSTLMGDLVLEGIEDAAQLRVAAV